MSIVHIALVLVVIGVVFILYNSNRKKKSTALLEKMHRSDFSDMVKLGDLLIGLRKDGAIKYEVKADKSRLSYSLLDEYGWITAKYFRTNKGSYVVSMNASPKVGKAVGVRTEFSNKGEVEQRIKILVDRWNNNLDHKYRKDSDFYKRCVALIRGVNDDDREKLMWK